MSLKDKVTVITGGSRGIGESIVRVFLREGARVVFTNPNEQNGVAMMKALEKEGLAKNARYCKADISKEADVQALVAFVTKTFGDCEVLCNNAGIFVGGAAHETSLEDWNRLFAVNVTGLYLCCKHFIPAMLKNKKGAIVNTSSISGMLGEYNMAAYCATKGAVGNLTRAMALDYADCGIRVNAVCPGATKTPMFMTGTSPALMKRFEAVFPPRRIGLPEEVAEAIAFLASDNASFINGVLLPVDGGISAHSGQPRQDKNEG
ncbi:MAG: SDR family oxidoreductase [Rectinemataceae bacterium]|jgi:meso-butanediol dehydrogenase/(S,S)-butanediol dehydrogenase/diacetyl reductase